MRPPPLSDEERRARNRRLVELKQRLGTLVDRLADRLPKDRVEEMAMLNRVGEWRIAMQVLAARLVDGRIPITPDERDEFEAVLAMFGPPLPHFPMRHVDDPGATLTALNVQETDPPAE